MKRPSSCKKKAARINKLLLSLLLGLYYELAFISVIVFAHNCDTFSLIPHTNQATLLRRLSLYLFYNSSPWYLVCVSSCFLFYLILLDYVYECESARERPDSKVDVDDVDVIPHTTATTNISNFSFVALLSV